MAVNPHSRVKDNFARRLAAPLYLPTILTGAKSFADNPVIGSPLLNRLGLHPARMLLSRAMAEMRRAPLGFAVSAEDKAAFRRDGFLVKQDFLPDDHFKRLQKEVRNYRAQG